MSDKYTIKNCELICNGECPNSKTGYCQDCTDCKLKQIVELCKAASEFCRECSKEAIYQVDCIECTKGGKAELGTEILELLDIQEVE